MESPAVRLRFPESRLLGSWTSRGEIQKARIAVPEGIDHFVRSGIERIHWMHQNESVIFTKN